MCLLIVLAGLDGPHPLVVASNRDERLDRKGSPPGLFVGARHRILSPRDRLAGGTWLAVSDIGMFAGLTNFIGGPPLAKASSRGHLPHLALDQDDLQAATDAVVLAVRNGCFNNFQLVLSDTQQIRVIRHLDQELQILDPGQSVVVTNEHAPGVLVLPELAEATARSLDTEQRLQRLAPILVRDGSDSGHRILKRGDQYGTVSSALVAVSPTDPLHMIWQHAAGAPDQFPYRNYGNLARRLLE